MFSSIKEYFIKQFIVKMIIAKLDAILATIPGDGKKMAVGILISCVGLVLSLLPSTSPFAQPVLDYLHTMPYEELIIGGAGYAVFGAFHKALKFILGVFGVPTVKEKEIAVIAKAVAKQINK